MQPDPVESLWQATQVQFNAGDLTGARVRCHSILAAQPLHSGANLLLANLDSQSGRHRAAVAHALRAAQKMGRQSLQHVAAVALKLISLGEYGPARDLILKINPAAVPAPSSLAEFSQQLSLLEQHDEALVYMEAALRQGLDGDWVHYVHGNYLKFVGRMESAAEAYERSLRSNPHYALAHHALAFLGHGGDIQARVASLRRSLALLPAGHRDLAYLNYALFKELDAVGEVDQAWQALQAGFSAKRRQIQHDAADESALFDALIEATAEGFEPAVGNGDGPTPVFVLGMPRTGTTLLERILGGNSRVSLCGELNDFRMQYKWCSDYFCLGFFDRHAVSLARTIDYAELGRRYLSHVAWRIQPQATHFTDKNPGNFMMAGLVLRALPQARIIHLRRNPMDSCFSNLKELFGSNAHPYSYDFAELATHYRNYSRLMAHWHAIAPGRILDINYEDLVSDPETTARRITAYCNLEYDPGQIRVESNAAPVSTASSVQVRQPIHSRNVGGWRRYAAPLAPLQSLLDAAWD